MISSDTLLGLTPLTDNSPFTGYGRAHWERIAGRFISGFLNHVSQKDSRTLLNFPKGDPGYVEALGSEDGIKEAMERSMVLAASIVAGCGTYKVAGYDGDITEPYLKWVLEGVDSKSAGSWGAHERFSAFGTCVALSMLIAPQAFWDPLSAVEKLRVSEFMVRLTEVDSFDNNHWYFHMLPAPLLDRAGVSYNRKALDEKWDRLLGWSLGKGWFIDGNNRGIDYYNAWGFHLYNLILCHFDEEWRSKYLGRVRVELDNFLESYLYFFDARGGMAPYGRSLSYRFASVSPFVWSCITGLDLPTPGICRRVASASLKYFYEGGCLNNAGYYEPGFRSPNYSVAENYIAPGAPYFSSVSFAALLLPESAPFWSAREEPLPQDSETITKAAPEAGLVLKTGPGSARLYPVGQPKSGNYWQMGIKYFQHSYDSRLGFIVTGCGGPDLGANRTGVSMDGETWCFRTRPTKESISEDSFTSSYDFEDHLGRVLGKVWTHTVVLEHGELHLFYHDCRDNLFLWCGGYGLQYVDDSQESHEAGERRAGIVTKDSYSLLAQLTRIEGSAHVEIVAPRPGWTNSHLFGGAGIYPYWKSSELVKAYEVAAIYASAGKGPLPETPDVTVNVGKNLIEVSTPAGHRRIKLIRSR